MITIDGAWSIAAFAHAGQESYPGNLRLYHLRRVASILDDEREKIIGILHELMIAGVNLNSEPITPAMVRSCLGYRIARDLMILRHWPHESLEMYCDRICSSGPAYARVKAADLADEIEWHQLSSGKSYTEPMLTLRSILGKFERAGKIDGKNTNVFGNSGNGKK